MTHSQRDMAVYGVVALVGAAFLLRFIPTWTPAYPGYGAPASLLPNIAAGFMLVLALIGLGRTALAARREAPRDGQAGAAAIPWGHLARLLIPCALCMPAMATVGFIPAGVAFLAVIQYACGQRRPGVMALVAATPVLIVYALMRFGLGVPLP